MRSLDWLDQRTCIWVRLTVFLFALELVTGFLLMTGYSPSTNHAWGSVWYIQTQVSFGWLIRGLHHFGSDALILVVLAYIVWLLVRKAYRSPGELVWWAAMALLGVALALSLTGHLLPWDQKGYWGTTVRLNILARTPLLGEGLKTLLVGGSELGTLTLTRFHALHTVGLPVLFAAFLAFGRWGARRHAAASDTAGAGAWTRSVAYLGVLMILMTIIGYARSISGSEWLDAPADPTTPNYPARPEWHTLFLFQWLKSFEGPTMEVLGAIVAPGFVTLVFVLFPFFDRVVSPRLAHRLAVAFTALIGFSVLGLTYAAVRADRDPAEATVLAARQKFEQGLPLSRADEKVLGARRFNRQRTEAARVAARSGELVAEHGVPPEGPAVLLRNDPMTRGPTLFATHCAACHRYHGHDGVGTVPLATPTSSDLGDYATKEWIRGLLSNPMADGYFGRMVTPEGEPAHTRMSRWITEMLDENETEQDRRTLFEQFDAVAAYLEDESLRPGRTADHALIRRGHEFFLAKCNECHSYAGERRGTTRAPEMFGYGSVPWIELMIADPAHESRYRSVGRERARMPAFLERLSESDRRLIAQWLHDSRTITGATITETP